MKSFYSLGSSCIDVSQREGNEQLMALLRAYEIVAREGVADPSKAQPTAPVVRPSIPSAPKPIHHGRKPLPPPPASQHPPDNTSSLKETLNSTELYDGDDLLSARAELQQDAEDLSLLYTPLAGTPPQDSNLQSPPGTLRNSVSPIPIEEEEKHPSEVSLPFGSEGDVPHLEESGDVGVDRKEDLLSSDDIEGSLPIPLAPLQQQVGSPPGSYEQEKTIMWEGRVRERASSNERRETFTKAGKEGSFTVPGDKEAVSLFSIGAARTLPREEEVETPEEHQQQNRAGLLFESADFSLPDDDAEIADKEKVGEPRPPPPPPQTHALSPLLFPRLL